MLSKPSHSRAEAEADHGQFVDADDTFSGFAPLPVRPSSFVESVLRFNVLPCNQAVASDSEFAWISTRFKPGGFHFVSIRCQSLQLSSLHLCHSIEHPPHLRQCSRRGATMTGMAAVDDPAALHRMAMTLPHCIAWR